MFRRPANHLTHRIDGLRSVCIPVSLSALNLTQTGKPHFCVARFFGIFRMWFEADDRNFTFCQAHTPNTFGYAFGFLFSK